MYLLHLSLVFSTSPPLISSVTFSFSTIPSYPLNASVLPGLYEVHRGIDLYLLFMHIFQVPRTWWALNKYLLNEQILECTIKIVEVSLKYLIVYMQSRNNSLITYDLQERQVEERFHTYWKLNICSIDPRLFVEAHECYLSSWFVYPI